MLARAVTAAVALFSRWPTLVAAFMTVRRAMVSSPRVIRRRLLSLAENCFFYAFWPLNFTRARELLKHNLVQHLQLVTLVSVFTHFETLIIQDEATDLFDLFAFFISLLLHDLVLVVLMQKLSSLLLLNLAVCFILVHLLIKLSKLNRGQESDLVLFD